jgi:hypothetical protein
LVLGVARASSASASADGAAEEEVPGTVAQMPSIALEEVRDQWLESPTTAAETVRRMSVDLRAVSPAAIDDGPRGLDALARTLGDPRATSADLTADLQRAEAALAVHHAREAEARARHGLPVHAATELRVAAGHLEQAALSMAVTDEVPPSLLRARTAAEEVLSGGQEPGALQQSAQEIARNARRVARANAN